MRIPANLLVHTVTVEPYRGTSSTGPLYGAPFQLACMRQGGNRLVRDADGNERVSSTTLYAAPGQAATIQPGSRVSWQLGTRTVSTTVMVATDHDGGGLGTPDHTEVACE